MATFQCAVDDDIIDVRILTDEPIFVVSVNWIDVKLNFGGK